jgi:hypothetical protein
MAFRRECKQLRQNCKKARFQGLTEFKVLKLQVVETFQMRHIPAALSLVDLATLNP